MNASVRENWCQMIANSIKLLLYNILEHWTRPSMQFKWYTFDEMEASKAIGMLSLRHRVFGEELLFQGQQVDDWDKISQHLCVTDGNEVIACLRVCQLVSDSYDTYEIGRLCVDKNYRYKHIGKKMMGMALLKGMGNGLEARFETKAPVYLMEFYRSVGFEPMGDPWVEDDVPFVYLKLSQQPSLLEMQTSPEKVVRRPAATLRKR